MTVIGLRPDDVVTDTAGNVKPGVTVKVYDTQANATAGGSTGLLASPVTDVKGRWSADVAGGSWWVRLPSGDLYEVADWSSKLDLATANATFETPAGAQAKASVAVAKSIGGTVVILGDSITNQSSENAGVNDPDTGTKVYAYKNTGYFGWVQTLMGHRFHLLRNAGVSGERSDQIRARIAAQVVPYAPEWCIVLAGTNDVLQSIAQATATANITGIYDDLLAAGIKVIACTIPPNNSATTTAQKQTLHGTNAAIRDYARSHRGVVVVDWHAAIADANTGSPVANATSDGTHPTAFGAYLLGRVMADALDRFIPPTLTLLGSNADPFNLLTNGRMNGTAGSLPAGMTGAAADSWSYGWETTVGTAVLSKVPRTDGIQGQWQQIALSAAGTFRMFQQQTTLSAWGLTAGTSKVRAEIEFEADADWNTLTRFGLDVEFFNGGDGIGSALQASNATWTGINPRKGVLRTPIITVPATAARVQMFLRFFGAGGTLRVDRARFVKVS